MAVSQVQLALSGRPRRRLRRPRLQKYPLTIERQYARELRGVANRVIGAVERRVLPELERWARLAGVREDQLDDWVDELEATFAVIRRDFDRTGGELRQVAERVAVETSAFNRAQVGGQISAVVGAPLLLGPVDEDVVKGFVNANVQAIQSIPSQYLDLVGRIISDGFRSGRRAEALAGAIADLGGVTRRRARFIARDQISTLNAQLTQRRQRALGVDKYIWRTSLDERVRPAHAALEGSEQSWDDPPTVGKRQVHPGEDYNCRCTAEPIIEGVEPEPTSPADVPKPLPRRTRRRPQRQARRRS